jgi:hypothetical protein
MAIVNMVHKKAVKAAAARMVVKGTDPRLVGWSLAGAVMEHELEVGDLSSTGELTRYAAGVSRKAEKVSNRQWDQYHEFNKLVGELVETANQEIADYLM